MKKKFGVCVILLTIFISLIVTLTQNTIAIENIQYSTTLTDSDGLGIEIATIQNSEVGNTEEYILANINEKYAKADKIEARDIIYVKNLLVDGSKFSGAQTIDELHNGQEDAFLMLNDVDVILYDTDENSEYYVGYVDTMHNNPESVVKDHSFAYTNLWGEVIEDAIYEYETGLAYVPKKYTNENKNEQGALNTQVELLQVVDNENPKSTINVIVNSNQSGNYATSGKVVVNSLRTEFGMYIALDEETINFTDKHLFKVMINDVESHNWDYYKNEGILVIKEMPNNISSLSITISEDNIDENLEYFSSSNDGIATCSNDGIVALDNSEDMEIYTEIGTWIVDPNNLPEINKLYTIEASNTEEGLNADVVDFYTNYPASGTSGNHTDSYTYGINGDTDWTELIEKIIKGKDIDLDNLQKSNSWMQHYIKFNSDISVPNSGITIPSGGTAFLKCVHNSVSWSYQDKTDSEYGNYSGRLTNDPWFTKDGYNADGKAGYSYAWKIKMRVYSITDDYMIVGLITGVHYNQAGAGMYKIAYTTGKGELEVGKRDSYGNWVAGAKLGIWGPNDYYKEIWTEDGKTTIIPDLEKGQYKVVELEAPQNMVINEEEKRVVVKSKETAKAYIDDDYQRGSATLIKCDKENPDNTQGEAKLGGAEFNFCAATDIYEGGNLKYNANQVIKAVVTNDNGETEVIDDLPIGEYYYIETKPSQGFMTNEEKINVSIKYTGQNNNKATQAEVICEEAPEFNDLVIKKSIGETANTEKEPLSGAVFTARLDDDPSKEYISVSTGRDGEYIIKNMPFGHYTIEETTVPANTLKCSDFTLFVQRDRAQGVYTLSDVDFVNPNNTLDNVVKQWLDEDGSLVDEPEVMKIKIRKVDKDGWEKKENPDYTQGEAVLKGAIYSIYEWNQSTNSYSINPIKEIAVDHQDAEGYWCAEQDNLIVGKKYMVKEKVKYTQVVNGVICKYSYAEGYLVDETEYEFYQQPEAQTTKRTYHEAISKEKIILNDLIIKKSIGETASSKKEPLNGAVFTARLDDDPSKEYTSVSTDNAGEYIIKDIPYGHYTIEETTVPANTLKCSNFTLFVQKDKSVGSYTLNDVKFINPVNNLDNVVKQWLDEDGRLIDEPKVIHIKIRKVDKDGWEGNEKVDFTQGDAVLKGAIYSIYEWDESTNSYSSKPLMDITVNHQDAEGYWCAEQDNLIVGKKYMIKEKVKSIEIKDGVTVKYSYAEGYLVDETEYEFYQQPETQTTKRTYHEATSKEEVVRGSLELIKYNNNPESTDEEPSKGAILRLTLDKNPNIWYEVTIDENGYGKFLDKNDGSHTTSVNTHYGEKYYPYTIPYGEYTLTETQESNPNEHTSYFIQPESVVLSKNMQKEYRIESDEPVSVWLRVTKVDKSTSEWKTVGLPGAEFKIWDVSKKNWVKMIVNPYGEEDTFKTNEEGYFYTPQQLYPGKYVIYETKAPKGYYLQDEWRLPEKEKDLGNASVSGKEIIINKLSTGTKDDTIYPEGGIKVGELQYEVKIPDNPLKGKIKIIKTGEMLTGYKETTKVANNNEIYTITEPVYEQKGLAGVEYTLTVKEDIKSPDGTQTYAYAGEKYKITTDENGYAMSDELYLGTYEIKETKTPLGYITEKNIPDITLVNEDQTERVKTTTIELNNKKQPTQVEVEKVLENPKYDVKEDCIGVGIGLYANEDLFTYDGRKVIGKNTLLDVVEGKIDTNALKEGRNTIILTSNVNLPNNKTYYAKELYVDYPYEIEKEKKVFEVKAKNTDDEVLKVSGITINNEVMETAELAFVKISTSALIYEEEALKGGKLTQAEFDKLMDPVVKWVNRNSASTVKKVFNGELKPDDPNVAKCRLDSKYTLVGATYSIYYDENKKQPLTKDGVPVTVTTDDNGYASLSKIPIGEYYIFEEVAPVLTWGDKKISYEKEEKPVKVVLSQLDKDNSVARLLLDDMIVEKEFIKTDIFTGELVPDCIFEITNSEGKTIVNAKTDNEGKFSLKLDWFEEGETYFYKEISAPEIYDLNTEPHEFKIEFEKNGELIRTEVENRRKTRDLLIRKTDAETGELLQGCVFTIAMVNEDGTQKINAKTGEPIYLVEKAVTDENGEYYIEDAPMGTYMFTEITPPEGYKLDEDLTGYTFTLDENSPELTIFEVTNTGDIAVIALSCIAVVSVLGIVFVILKNKKQRV